jgi:hypothetical protein
MSNGDLQNRTLAAIRDLEPNVDTLRKLLAEWVKESPLLGNLYRSRALNGRLMDDQKHLIGALQVGIKQAERFPNDGPMQTFCEIAAKRIAEAIPTDQKK